MILIISCVIYDIMTYVNIRKKENKIEVFGYFGSKSENNTKLNIKANSGEINIFSN